MIQHTTPLTERQSKTLSNGGQIVVLSPDDLMTLRQERNEYKQALFQVRDEQRERRNWQRMLETLERILNQ